MSGAGLRILHELRESAVELRAAARIDRLVGARREQRMGEPDAVVLELDDVGGDRRSEAAIRRDSRRLFDQADRGLGQRRRGAQELSRLHRKLQQPTVHQLAQRIRNRQAGSRLDPCGARAAKTADDLERVERVTSGRFVHFGEQRAGDRDPELLLHDPVQRVEVERPDLDVVERAAERSPQIRYEPRFGQGSLREQDSDVLVAQAPYRIGERAPRSGVEPLHVVDRDHDGGLRGEPAYRAEQRDADRARVGCRPVVHLEHERQGQRSALCFRQRLEGLAEHRIEQIPDGREGQRRLALGGHRLKDAEAACLAFGYTGPPERRLPHPCVALEHERPGALAEARDEVAE